MFINKRTNLINDVEVLNEQLLTKAEGFYW